MAAAERSKRTGRAPVCECGQCRTCLKRTRYVYTTIGLKGPRRLLTDEELEKLMTDYFLAKGWDQIQ